MFTNLARATADLNHWIEIDLDALDANATAVRTRLEPAELIAVVKANAYGHGALEVSRSLSVQGTEWLAVAWLSEALHLRRAGISCRILAMEHIFPANAVAVVTNDIDVCCHSLELAGALAKEGLRLGRPARVHLKVDTGLHRFGLALADATALGEKLRGMPGLEVAGLWTHMANADESDDSYSDSQAAMFDAAAAAMPWIPFKHSANSATALRRPELRHSASRVGVMLYGVVPDNTPDPGLRPVLSLKARAARVMDLAEGDGVSYGLEWKAKGPARAALVPVGYADGWRRSLGNKGAVLVGGQRVPMIGRVCMDQFLIDVTGVAATEGDEITLLGKQREESITAAEVAALTGTIPWETLSALGRRIPRIYHRRGEVVAMDEAL